MRNDANQPARLGSHADRSAGSHVYVFIDEGGNLDFSPKGTKHFTLTALSVVRPFKPMVELAEFQYDCIEYGEDIEYFHCAEDNSHVRRRVFEIIGKHLSDIRADALIVEKPKTHPKVQADVRFYPEMMGHLLRYVLDKVAAGVVNSVVVITDQIPINRKRKAIEGALKSTLKAKLPKGTQWRVLHHQSKAHSLLQVADYINWAVFRKWERSDDEYWQLIKPALRSEFNIFQKGSTHYYPHPGGRIS